MPSIDYRTMRSAVPMEQVLQLLHFVPIDRSGEQLRGPCPIRGSKSPQSRSFSVNLQRSTFRCFTCEAQGNQLDLWSKATGQPLYPAAIALCEALQMEVPTLGARPITKSEKRNP